MGNAAERILDDAMKLPASERRVLALCLLDSVGDEPPQDIEHAWIEEAQQRLEALRAGTSSAAPLDEAKARMFAKA